MAAYTARNALLSGIIDYAGTFPPAKLPLEAALAEYCGFRAKGRNPWLMAKMVVTVADLKKLSARMWFEAGADGRSVPLTVIGSPVEKSADLARTVAFELRELRRFNEKYSLSAVPQTVLSYETRIPEDCPAVETGDLVHEALDLARTDTGLGFRVYFEVGLGGDWQRRLATFQDAIAQWNEDFGAGAGDAALKVRTGGATPPTHTQLAEILGSCVLHATAFKATQGLHHAVTRASEWGFVNVFSAITFAQALGLEKFPVATIEECLKETRGAAFEFSKEALRWRTFTLPCEAIEAARRHHAGCFGSCSIVEPDDFLTQEIGQEDV